MRIRIAAALAAAGTVALTGLNTPADAGHQSMATWMQRPCRTEDSVNCYWDAQTRGNHRGHSFYVRQFPGSKRMVCVMYVQPRYAKHHDYCEATA